MIVRCSWVAKMDGGNNFKIKKKKDNDMESEKMTTKQIKHDMTTVISHFICHIIT